MCPAAQVLSWLSAGIVRALSALLYGLLAAFASSSCSDLLFPLFFSYLDLSQKIQLRISFSLSFFPRFFLFFVIILFFSNPNNLTSRGQSWGGCSIGPGGGEGDEMLV